MIGSIVLARSAAAVDIQFQVLDLPDVTPGQNLYRYAYTLSGFPHPAGFGFSVEFDRESYASLQSPPPAPGPGWDAVALQPDPLLSSEGQYDARALVGSPNPSASFAIDFVWLGDGTPGSQPFTVYDAAFAPVESGQTVPEPGLAFGVLGGAALLRALSRRRRRLRLARSASWGLIAVIAGALPASAEIEIDHFEVVTSTRLSRTVFEYTLKADGSNWGDADANVTATLASTDPATVVVDGALDFGALAEGATGQSSDTFTIRQDRRTLVDPDKLVWTTQVTALPPTTFELIEQALADGVIDAETALVYKVFAEFGDARLPVAYRGRASGAFEASALEDAELDFETLSPATQAILAPFLAPEDVSGVPLASGGGPGAAANQSAAAPASAPPGGWSSAWVVEDEIMIFWDDDVPGEAILAGLISHEIETVIWPKLTDLFGRPPAVSGRFIEVFVQEGTMETSRATSHRCTTNPEVHLAPQHHALNYVWAHELMHALLYYRYPTLSGCNQSWEYRWMHEATAKWAEHYVYPTTMGNREHESAPNFLNEPALPLEHFGDNHQYGAYLWFFYLSKGKTSATDDDVKRVASTWRWTQFYDSLGAVDAAVVGDLEEEWPEFALYNWNRLPHVNKPYREYYTWDRMRHKARESTAAVAPGGFQPPKKLFLNGRIYGGHPLPHRIHHLGAKYWHFDFTDDEKIRRIRLRHPYSDGSQPKARVQVITKIQGEQWGPAQDWTAFERKTLCRDKQGQDGNPSQNVEEMVVIISDSEHQDRNHVLDDSGSGGPPRTILEMSALGCTNWVGQVDSSTEGTVDGIHMTEEGTVRNLRWVIDQDRFSAQIFRAAGGDVHWTHAASGVNGEGDACSGESEGDYTVSPSPFLAGLEFSAVFGTNPPLAPKYNAYALEFGQAGPADYDCVDADPPHDHYTMSPIYGAHDAWIDFGERFISANSFGLYDSHPLGQGLLGAASVQYPFSDYKTSLYIWSFTQDPNPATRFEGFAGEPQD